MKFTKIAAAALTLWALVYAHPTFAQVSPEPNASLSECAGCQSGNITVVFDGGTAFASGLKFDASANGGAGAWVGSGSVVDYNRAGVVANGPAQFVVVFKTASEYGITPCSAPNGTPLKVFVDSFQILCGNVLFESTGAPVFDTSACPTETIPAVASVVAKGRGKVKKEFNSSLGKVKAGYIVTPTGRYIKAVI